jgi:UDP:flavonoid glycosyltransferase YjiC (YdhE family)
MKRVLLVAEAVTLAHVTRCLALSSTLTGYEVHVAWDPRYNRLIGALPARYSGITTIPGKQFFAALARGMPIYSISDLMRYVTEDLALLDRVRPDVVVGDFRLSLDVSARLAGVRYVTVTNAHWSPHVRVPAPVPDITLTRLFGVRLGQRLFDLGQPAVGRWHARPFRRLRRRFGLPADVPDVRHAYTQADQTLFADIAELFEAPDLDGSDGFIGPVLWSPDVPLPPLWEESWDERPTDRPLVYVSLGSSGRRGALDVVLRALADLPVVVVAAGSAVTAAGHAAAGPAAAGAAAAGPFVAEMLPADRILPRASLVIGNGGSAGSYQALAAGRPVIGICTNLDQYFSMSLVERAGAGWLVRGGRLSAPALRDLVRRALGDDAARSRAAELANVVAGYEMAERFRNALS